MVKILFVCHGNICRSPMAEYIMLDILRRRGLEAEFEVSSAATSREEIGNPVYTPARRALERHNVPCGDHRAVQMTKQDYRYYDLLLCADSMNLKNMQRIVGGDPAGKMHRLLDYSASPRDIADPWYTGDFEKSFADIVEGCEALLQSLGY